MPFSKLRAPSAGFTLIELLVVITIMMILLGGAIAGFLRFRDNQAALASSKNVQQLLRLAQTKATAGEYPEAITTCDKTNKNKYLQGYRVKRTGQVFDVMPICGKTTALVDLSEAATIKSITVPSNVTIDSPATTVFTDFYALGGGVRATRTYTFKANATSRQYTFNVTTTGAISNAQ